MGATKVVTDATFDAEVVKNSKPVIVDYWAEWCGPCRQVAPVLEEIAKEHADKIDVVKLNIEENPQTAQKYGIMLIPTLNVFSGGEVVKQVVGAKSKSALLKELAEFIWPAGRAQTRTSGRWRPAWCTRTPTSCCAATRSSAGTAAGAPTPWSTSPTSRWSSRPRRTGSAWSRSSGTRSGGAPGHSRRAGSLAAATGDPAELARLELAQETGLRASRLTLLGYLHCAHGTSSQGFHAFLATGLTQGEPDREPSEQDMRQRWVTRGEFKDMILNASILDDSTVAAYSLLLLHEERR